MGIYVIDNELYKLVEIDLKETNIITAYCNSCDVSCKCREMNRLICFTISYVLGDNTSNRVLKRYKSSLYSAVCLKYTYREK